MSGRVYEYVFMTEVVDSAEIFYSFRAVGLTALGGCFPFLYVAIGRMTGTGHFDGRGHDDVSALFGGPLVITGLFLAGRRLSQRRSHLFRMIVAAIACLLFPFGKVFGVFTLIVLSRPSVK